MNNFDDKEETWMERPIIVIGAGGHARPLLDILTLRGCDVIGLTDCNELFWGQSIMGFTVLGDDHIIMEFKSDSVLLVNAIGMVDQDSRRREGFEFFKTRGYNFGTLVHPFSMVSSFSSLAEGVQVMAGAIVQAQTVIGRNTIVNTGARIDHECNIGNNVHIAPGTILSGRVSIGDNALIGAGATIIQGISIGNNCIVGAGSVVLQDVPDGYKVVGVPAKHERKTAFKR